MKPWYSVGRMKRYLVVGFCVLLFAAPLAWGQSVRVEAFTGYSLSRQGDLDLGNLHGWNVAVISNLNEWASIVADLSGHYASQNAVVLGVPVNSDIGLYTYRFGPRFQLARFGRFNTFAHALAGGNYIHASSSFVLNNQRTGQSGAINGFAAAVGAGLDWDLNDRVSLRFGQMDYSVLRVDRDTSNGFRFSSGVVFKFY